MKTAGIVAEYNPFHTGHAYQIARTRAMLGEEAGIIAVMSGNWVQQAHCAIFDKWTRARLALMGGADLVLELPTPWATASAESFARGAVHILDACGVVDHLSFGSEHGDVTPLAQLAACLDTPEYQEQLQRLTAAGATFAACRQQAVENLLGPELASLLSSPNNNLGIEYIRALRARASAIQPMTVPRQGAAHNAISTDKPPFVSATHIRHHLKEGRAGEILPYLNPGAAELIMRSQDALLERAERAILAKLRTMSAQDWAALPDSGASEGLPQRLERAGKTCVSLAHFLELTKTKRYTHARLRRLVLWAYLGLTAGQLPGTPPYIRVLAFNSRGRELLKTMKKAAALPILTKPAHGQGQSLFEFEARCTDLYDLCLQSVPTPGREWTTSPVMLL